MIKTIRLYLASLLLLTNWANASSVFFQIDGLSEILEKRVRAQLSSIIQNEEVMPNERFYAHIDTTIRECLKAFGYYEPTINLNLCSSSQIMNARKILIIHVNTGIPIRIARINVVLRGEARTDEDYLNLLDSRPSAGTVLNHGDFLNFKKSLTNIALRKGYFDSRFNVSHLIISLTKHKACWDIDYDSGYRYHFGSVLFEESQIRDEYLQNLIPFKRGDFFDSKELSELIRRLSTIGWFDSIVITPDFNKIQNKFLNFRGVVSPHIKNIIETGIGYSTNVGPRAKGAWKRPWINSYGHSLKIDANVSLSERQLSFNYKIPILKNPLEQYYLVQGVTKLISLNDITDNSSTFIVSRYWDLSNDLRREIRLRISRNHFMWTDANGTSILLCAGITLDRNRSYGNKMPSWNNYKRYSLEYSNRILGSDVNFIVAQAQNTWTRTLYDQHRFIIRENFGWIETGNFDKVPLDFRFFAGGDHSIRGYKYKSLSSKNKESQLIGSSRLITGSLEYQYKVNKKWWGAMFIDGGEAVRNILCSDFKAGVGIGIRWKSPIGPIKLDFAIPIGDEEEHSPQFYIGLDEL